MIDKNNQNWVEGFVKESADYGLTVDQAKDLLAEATHIQMYKESAAYREGFDKEAGKADLLRKGLGKLKGLFGKAAPAASKAKGPTLGGIKPLGQSGARAVSKAKPGMGALKPLGTTAAKATATAGKAAPAAGKATGAAAGAGNKMKVNAESLNKAKNTAAASRGAGSKGTGSQKSTTPKDTAGDEAAAGAEQARGFFDRFKTPLTLGGGAAGLYGFQQAGDAFEDAQKRKYMNADDYAAEKAMGGSGSASEKLRRAGDYQNSKEIAELARLKAKHGRGGGSNYYRRPPVDVYNNTGM